jgi:hypothetical protein
VIILAPMPPPGLPDFIGTTYQNMKNIPNDYKTFYINGHKMYQMTIKYPNVHKLHLPKFSIPRLSKIYSSLDFWYENIPSGNPGHLYEQGIRFKSVP